MAKSTSLGRWAAAISVGLLAFVAVSALVWRDDILRTWLDPKQPFQTYRPPPAPDYDKPEAWALIPAKPTVWTSSDPAADVFFIYPTTFDGGPNWNAPIADLRANRLLSEVMLPNYAGPFQRVGRVFAPRYRQASLYAFTMTNREDAQEARRFAYGDVHRAFQTFLDHDNGGRPIVIVGVGQGGFLAARLTDDAIANDSKLSARLAAVYLIDTIASAASYGPGSPLPACRSAGEAHCILAWEPAASASDATQLSKRALVWTAAGNLDELRGRPLCTNPLLGTNSTIEAPLRLNIGAANASGLEWGVRPAFLPRQVSAQCIDGFLRVSKPLSPSLQPTGGWTDRMKVAPFNLFYADEEADAKVRVSVLTHAPGYVPPAAPVGDAIVISHAAVHRIP